MINVNAKQERVYTKVSGDYIYGSVLVNGGKDPKGNYKANGFMGVSFSNDCQDMIYNKFYNEKTKEAVIPTCILADMTGFIAWEEFNDVKRPKLVITTIGNIAEYVKEEKQETPATSHRRSY